MSDPLIQITSEDKDTLDQLRQAWQDLDFIITGDMALSAQNALDQQAADLAQVEAEIRDIQNAVLGYVFEALDEIHEWDQIVYGRPDYKIDKCMICGMERSTDLHTGEQRYVAP